MELIPTSADELPDLWRGVLENKIQDSPMRFKLGAILIKKGRVVAVGNNHRKTNPRYGVKADFMTLHAEGDLLYSCYKLGIDTRKTTMIVYRKNGKLARPCIHCQKLIEKAGIKKVIYTNG